MTLRLGYRPAPHQNESLNGYLLRLAEGCGIDKLSAFLHALGIVKPKIARWGLWRDEELDALSKALSNVCERDMEPAIHQLAVQMEQRWFFSEGRLFNELRLDYPRICPLCMGQQAVFDWRWFVGTVARCERHKEQLFDCCPKCDTPFIWHAKLLSGCPHCSVKWHDHVASKWTKTPLTPFEARMYPSTEGVIDATSGELAALCIAIHAAARPFDVYYDRQQRLPYSPEYGTLLLHAMSLLQHIETIEQWREAISLKRATFTVNAPTPIDVFEQLISSINFTVKRVRTSQLFILIERPGFIRRMRQKSLAEKNEVNETRHYLVDSQQLASIYAIPFEELVILTDASLLPQTNLFSANKDSLFDLRAVAELLQSMDVPKQGYDYVEIALTSPIFVHSHTRYGQLVKLIISNVIEGYFTTSKNLSSVQVDKQDLVAFVALPVSMHDVSFFTKYKLVQAEAQQLKFELGILSSLPIQEGNRC